MKLSDSDEAAIDAAYDDHDLLAGEKRAPWWVRYPFLVRMVVGLHLIMAVLSLVTAEWTRAMLWTLLGLYIYALLAQARVSRELELLVDRLTEKEGKNGWHH